jgi:hypothetical protein
MMAISRALVEDDKRRVTSEGFGGFLHDLSSVNAHSKRRVALHLLAPNTSCALSGSPGFMRPFYHRFVSASSPSCNCSAAMLPVLNAYRGRRTA